MNQFIGLWDFNFVESLTLINKEERTVYPSIESFLTVHYINFLFKITNVNCMAAVLYNHNSFERAFV